MTTPGHEGLVQPHLIPQDQHSRWGWTRSRHIPGTPYWIDGHKLGTVLSLPVLSAAATSLTYLAHGQSFEGLDTTWHNTIHGQTTTGHTVYGPEKTILSHNTVTKVEPGKPQTLQYSVAAANMPDVRSFNLHTTPEAQVIINQSDFLTFIDTIVEDVREGYHIDSLNVSGVASDETELDANAGIGKKDPQNLSLAQQYQDFIRTALLFQLKEHHVAVPSTIDGKPHEAILNSDDIASFDAIRQDGHFATNLDLIEAFKSKHGLSNDDAEGFLQEVLNGNRGGNIRVHLVSPAAGHTITKIYEVTSKRCLSINTTYETVTSTQQQQRHGIPWTIIGLPMVRLRREQRLTQEADPEPDEPTPEPAPVPEPDNIDQRYGQGSLGSGRRRFRVRNNARRLTRAELDRWVARRERWNRLIKFGLLGALGASAIVAVAGARADTGYCPHPENEASQDWQPHNGFTHGFIPDTMRFRLTIPFTDIHTAWSGDLVLSACSTEANNNQLPAPQTYTPPAPTCDTRSVLIITKDGRTQKPIVTDETHYPGATKTTTTLVK